MDNKGKLHLYSIMPLDLEHIDEICEDIKLQYETGVSSCPLFSCTLVPEGNPPKDKATELCNIYDKFKEKLDVMGIPSGILVQATIGHGWVLSEMFPYQPLVDFNSGEMRSSVCPTDEGFKEYVRYIFTVIAQHKPDHIMLDDDFRLMFRAGNGCGCPEHMRRFNEKAGTNLSRAELWEKVTTENPDKENYTKIMVDIQLESLYETARVMREAIDAVDPTIPGSFCCVGNEVEGAEEIAKIMAGKGNPVVIRINNGNYSAQTIRDFPRHFNRAAEQIAKLKNVADVLLAETDTCPQNRYSTGAMSLHTHFTGTILEGAAGAKQWITRLSCWEPKSGTAYRKILSKNRGFYEALADIVPSLKWRGFRIPVTSTPEYQFGVADNYGPNEGWGTCVLERLGVPVFFGDKCEGIACLNASTDSRYSDEQIKEMLSHPIFLASDSASNLIKRGFGKYLGVDVRPWEGKGASGEMFNSGIIAGNTCKRQNNFMELIPTDNSVEVDSVMYHSVGKAPKESLFPAVTVYDNELGGKVFTFCGTPLGKYNLVEAYSFLNYSRKEQIIGLMKKAGEFTVYYPGDEEMYCRVADMPDGGLFCSLINTSTDPIDEIELVCAKKIEKIEILMCDGTRSAVEFEQVGEDITLKARCDVLNPVVLFLY